jgi:Tol biopolymer transport system component
VTLRLRIAIVVAISGALLGVATGCGAKPAADEAGLLVYGVGTMNGTAAAGLWSVDDEGGHRRRRTGPPPPSSVEWAEWSPKGGTILFWSDLTTDTEFWTIDADGTNLRLVGRGHGATWSPDGREIAIVLQDDEFSIVDRDGSRRRTIRLGLVKGEDPDGVHWSPDGSRIALNASEPDTTAHVAVVAADGQSPAEVLRNKNAPGVSESFADWSPDGKSIAFIRDPAATEDGPVSAWVMRSDGSGRRLIAANADAVAFSADGQSFLYVSSYPDKPALYRVPITGGEPKKVGAAPKYGDIKNPLVEPGGRRVIDLGGRLVVRDADGTARALLSEPHEDWSPVWSPNGREIAFVRGRQWATKGDVYLLNAAGESERFVAPNGSPVWLRDGRLVIERGKGFAYADLDPDRIAVPVDGTKRSISPDGALIAFVRDRSAPGPQMQGPDEPIDVQSTLYVRPWGGGPERELAKSPGSEAGPAVFDVPVWAPDGRSIFIEEEDPGYTSLRIRQIPVAGGEGRTVARGLDLELFAVAPDGKRIAIANSGTGIELVDLDEDKRTTIVPWVFADDIKWSPDGKKLAYVVGNHDNESVVDLYVVDADGSDRRLVSRPGDAVNSFDWRPGGEPRESR